MAQPRVSRGRRLNRHALSDGFRFPGREGEAMPVAVLVPPVNNLQVLTVRSATLGDHPGQIKAPREAV